VQVAWRFGVQLRQPGGLARFSFIATGIGRATTQQILCPNARKLAGTPLPIMTATSTLLCMLRLQLR
jgi:hypothetical protein